MNAKIQRTIGVKIKNSGIYSLILFKTVLNVVIS